MILTLLVEPVLTADAGVVGVAGDEPIVAKLLIEVVEPLEGAAEDGD